MSLQTQIAETEHWNLQEEALNKTSRFGFTPSSRSNSL